MDDLVIGQIGFASWPMLAWGIAAAIPVAIHLLRRFHSQKRPWKTRTLAEMINVFLRLLLVIDQFEGQSRRNPFAYGKF